MIRHYLLVFLFAFSYSIQAQNVSDALRYSRLESAPTARSLGIGGGMSALGGDFSVVNTNPAGLAIYRMSEFVITPSLDFTTTEGQLVNGSVPNQVADRSKTIFNISNLGIVLNSQPNGNWKTANFGIGLNRIANFKETFFFNGQSSGSFADRFLDLAYDANGFAIDPNNLDDFVGRPAFDAFAIDTFRNDNGGLEYFNDFEAFPDAEINRSQIIRRSGAINEVSLSLAGNLNNKLLIGGSIGIPILRYSESREYAEFDPGTPPDGNVDFFDALQFTDTLNTSAVGINLKLGVVYWATPKVRVGAAIHTPTAYGMTDYYDTSVGYTITDSFSGQTSSFSALPDQPLEFEYNYRTPWRFIGSGGVIINGFGFVTAEAEYVNYGGARFNLASDTDNAADEAASDVLNDEISNELKGALNLKIGAEYAKDHFRVRAGYNYLGATQEDGDDQRSAVSVGVGYRADFFYFDLGYRRSMDSGTYSPYSVADASKVQTVDRQVNSNKILLTFGYRF